MPNKPIKKPTANPTAKKDSVRSLKEVKITAARPKKQMVATKSGQIPAARVDSLKRANPTLARYIGSATKRTPGDMGRYGDAASDAIKAGLKKKK